MSQATKNLKPFLDALEHIQAGKPVPDLDERIAAIGTDPVGSVRGMMNLGLAIACSRYENRILQGENPEQVYGGNDIQRYRDNAHEKMRWILSNYKSPPTP